MTKWLALLSLLTAQPFWDTTDVDKWSEEQLIEFFENSPWAQPAESSNTGTGVVTFIATAKPVQLAERELRRRRTKKLPGGDAPADPAWDEFQEFLERDSAKYLVLAVSIPAQATLEASEMAIMESQSVIRVGKQKIQMSGYFPPSPTDGFTRLIFPKAGLENAKEIRFELFLPGTGTPYRQVFYQRKSMTYRGKPEM